jgi:hypothetical protein
MIRRFSFALALGMALAAASINGQQQQQQHQEGADCPMRHKHQGDKPLATDKAGDKHSETHAEMDRRGEQAMGFSQSGTTHHFLLRRDGGSIEVEVNEAADQTSLDRIRQHLAHIAQMFAEGDFNVPMFIHAQNPPGAQAMKRLKAEIKYEFEKTERGGRVNIRASNVEALTAIHDFLRFQIEEHRTGDPLEAN